MPSPQDATTRRDEYCAWLTANGIEPAHIPIDADITITTARDGTRSIVYEEFHLTTDGHRQIDERLQRAAIRKTSTPLIAEPPDWWQPYEKPTRDQLLAILKRVQALADEEGEMNTYIERTRLRSVLALAYEGEGL